jgi:hypothetical protein
MSNAGRCSAVRAICWVDTCSAASAATKLILRLGADRAAQCLKEDTVSEFDITTTPMKGWVMVSEQGFLTDKEVEQWLVMAREFVLSLPAKNK